MRQRYAITSALLCAAACAKATEQPRGDAGLGGPLVEQPIGVETAAAVEELMPTFLTVTGSLVANQQSEVAAGTSGKVRKTFVERGSFVPANAMLVQLDSRALSRQAEEAQANLEVSRRQRTLAEAQCQRQDKLFGDGAVSQDDYDKAKSNCETARFQAAASQARAEQALVGVNDSQIRAPFAGLVAERYVNAGEYVQPPTKVVSLVELDPLRLELSVPEASLQQIQQGLAVTFSTVTAPGVQFMGTIRYVGPAVRTASRDVVVEAVVANPNHLLHPGQFVAAKVRVGEKPSPLVPQSAIHAEGSLNRVYVVSAGRLEERLVELGDRKDQRVAVLSGLNAGEKVVTQAAGDLRDGLRVKGL